MKEFVGFLMDFLLDVVLDVVLDFENGFIGRVWASISSGSVGWFILKSKF